jgi:hypothetical protein
VGETQRIAGGVITGTDASPGSVPGARERLPFCARTATMLPMKEGRMAAAAVETTTHASALPFAVETDLETEICADPIWREGAEWGAPRPGHPEGAVKHHIAEVLANVDRYATDAEQRRRLRVIALTHDTFKHRVDMTQNRTGENHHGMIARRFTERFVADDPGMLDIIELHDEAYNAYSKGARDGRWDKAEERAGRLIDRLGDQVPTYVTFFRCDNETGSKAQDSYRWFVEFVA